MNKISSKKILVFLAVLILSITIVSAASNTEYANDTTTDTQSNTQTIQTHEDTAKDIETTTTKTTKEATNKKDVNIKVNSLTSTAGQKVNVIANMTTTDNTKVNISNSVLKISNMTVASSKVVNGVANFTFTMPQISAGSYTMLVKTGETTSLNSANATANLNVIRQNITVKTSNITTYAGKNVTLKATFTTDNLKKINMTNSVLKINGLTVASSSISNGTASYTFTVPNLGAGTKTVQIITGTTSLFNSNTANSTMTVNRQNLTVKFSNITTVAGRQVTLKATFNGQYLKNINLTNSVLKIANLTVASAKVVNGTASYTFTVPNISAGTYDMQVVTGTTSLFNNKTTTGKITINRQNLTIKVSNVSGYAGNTASVVANVSLSNGTKVNLSTSVLKLGSVTLANSTVTNGVAKFSFKILNYNPGNYTMTVKTGQTGLYNASTSTGILTILANPKVSTVGIKVSTNKTSQTTGQLTVTSTYTAANGTYSTSSSNTNAVLVKSGGVLSLINSTVKKTGDLSNSNSEDSEFYGTNSAVLVTSNSIGYIANTTIITNATGANAVFSSNLNSQSSGATINISNVNISTYKDKSRGLDATFGGIINAEYVTINTRGGSCAALATDRGEGTVNASNCVLNTGVGQTSGRGSPCIYSTGNITATNCTGTSYVSQIGCIEGKNSITLNGCNLTGYACGNRQSNGVYVDLGGFFIYQSMSGDADVGTATLNATNSRLTIASDSSYYSTAPMFHITNTAAIMNLNNCTLSFGSGVLLNISGQDQWGTSGSNGGKLSFTATNQTLTGKTIVDSISTLNLTLKKSTYNGAINPSSSYGTTRVVIDSSSTWTLTGNSHVTSLSNSGTINYGSYTLYVNGVAYTASNPY